MDRYCLNQFDGIIYINLAHRKDRNQEILSELNRLSTNEKKIHRFEAIFDPLNGHRGCALSHAKALQYAIDQNWNHTLILEDDCLFSRDADEIDGHIRHFLTSMNNQWDVFLLGGNIKSYKKTPFEKIHQVLSALCAHSYSVNKEYLKTLQTLFLYAYKTMESDPIFLDSTDKTLDLWWDYLMRQDRWYFTEIFAQQRDSFSDIILTERDRRHREKFS